jgi:hypothetical protein
MADRPTRIQISDLADPQLDARQKAVLEAASTISVDLTVDAVLSAARERAGLDDFGERDFEQRLAVWLQATQEDPTLGPAGRLRVFSDCVRYATSRLRMQDLAQRHPESLDVEIREPIIIAGLPRSGTTHLLNLIAADERLRCLPYWESLEPFPVPGEVPGDDGVDPRLARCRASFAVEDGLLPHLRAMHYMTPEHVHEEIELQGIDFGSYILEWIACVPRWRDYYLEHDQRNSYAFLRRALGMLQWLRGPDRWILKSPQHLEQIGPLYEAFPDATVVFTHRDPVSVIASAVTMNAYGSRLRCSYVDMGAIGSYWVDRVERLLRACVRDRALVPPEKSLDVVFHEFMADDIATVENVYALAGLPMTDAARQSLKRFMDDNERSKYGRVVYDLKGDFGIDPDALRERFSFYFEAFPIQAEG